MSTQSGSMPATQLQRKRQKTNGQRMEHIVVLLGYLEVMLLALEIQGTVGRELWMTKWTERQITTTNEPY